MARIIRRLRKLGTDFWLGICAAVLMVLLLVQGVGYALTGKMASEFHDAFATQAQGPAREEAKDVAEYDSIVGNGVWGRKQPPPKPKLFGLLGDSALLGNDPNAARFYTLEANLPGGFKLVEMHRNTIVLERDGKRETLKLFPGLLDKVDLPPIAPPKPQEAPKTEEPKAAEQPQAPPPPSPPAQSSQPPPGQGRWQQMSPELREQMRRRMEEARRSGNWEGMRRDFQRRRQQGRRQSSD